MNETGESTSVVHCESPETEDAAGQKQVGFRVEKLRDVSNPRLKALLQYSMLPRPVKRRVRALKKLQLEMTEIEAEFFKRLSALEREFAERYAPLQDKRRDFISGDKEPSASDLECPLDEEDEEEEGEHKPSSPEGDEASQKTAGIPDFWLSIFQNVPMLAQKKIAADDDILRNLRDIRCIIHTPYDSLRPGFTLEFHFAPNEYFTNTVLTKEYLIRFGPSSSDPMSYEGPEIIQAKGCTINWKPGMDVTLKFVKRKALAQQNSESEEKKGLKAIKTRSFFNFFRPPAQNIDDISLEDLDEELEDELQTDFEVGQLFRERVITRAVLLYTGEALDLEESSTSDEDDEHPISKESSEGDPQEPVKQDSPKVVLEPM